MHRKFDWHAAGIADPMTHPLGQLQMDAVAWGKIAAGLAVLMIGRPPCDSADVIP
jgi:hypothetical protein